MDVKQLRYFVGIVDCGGFSQAARQLNVAQPALSQQIARLEYEVGAPLFVRSSRGATPTAKGVTLHRHARFILRQIENAIQSTREAETQISGSVAIGLPPTTSAQIGVQLIERLHTRYPGVVCNLVEGLSGNLRAQAASGSLDLAVLFTPSAVPEWTATPLLREELFLVLAKDSNLLPPGRRSVTLREMTEVPLILPSSQHGLRRRVDLEFERLNMTCQPVAEIDSLSVLMQCLRRGMAATVKPMAAVNVHGPALASQWEYLPISDASLTRMNYLYAPPPENASAATRVVHDEIVALVRDEISEGRWKGVSLPEGDDGGVPTEA